MLSNSFRSEKPPEVMNALAGGGGGSGEVDCEVWWWCWWEAEEEAWEEEVRSAMFGSGTCAQ